MKAVFLLLLSHNVCLAKRHSYRVYSVVYSHLLLDVLDEEGGSSEVVYRETEEALDFFLVEVHGDDVSKA